MTFRVNEEQTCIVGLATTGISHRGPPSEFALLVGDKARRHAVRREASGFSLGDFSLIEVLLRASAISAIIGGLVRVVFIDILTSHADYA